ncbi:Helitron helicase, partial [Phytophthora megakarya]
MYPTFHEAAMVAGYLENDHEWEECLLEASFERMPYQLCQPFGTILVYSLAGSPLGLWERFKSDLSEDFQRELGMDADDRKDIFDQVISAVESPEVGHKLFFVDGPGGTGKSFLLEQLLAKVRLEGGVAIAVASSGIAANVTDWRTISALDVLDSTQGENHLEGSGDHRQILPVLKDATRAETLKACFKASPLWRHLKQVRLFENMRVRTAPDPDDAAELAEFSEFLLQIGE